MGWQICLFKTPVPSEAIKQAQSSLDQRQGRTGLSNIIEIESYIVRREA